MDRADFFGDLADDVGVLGEPVRDFDLVDEDRLVVFCIVV
jgi:hypothetical protein